MDDYESKTGSRFNPLVRTDFLSWPEGCFYGKRPEEVLSETIEGTKKYYDALEKSFKV